MLTQVGQFAMAQAKLMLGLFVRPFALIEVPLLLLQTQRQSFEFVGREGAIVFPVMLRLHQTLPLFQEQQTLIGQVAGQAFEMGEAILKLVFQIAIDLGPFSFLSVAFFVVR